MKQRGGWPEPSPRNTLLHAVAAKSAWKLPVPDALRAGRQAPPHPLLRACLWYNILGMQSFFWQIGRAAGPIPTSERVFLWLRNVVIGSEISQMFEGLATDRREKLATS